MNHKIVILLAFFSTTILTSCKKDKWIDNYTGDYQFNISGYVSPDPFSAGTFNSSSNPSRSYEYNKVGSVKRKSKKDNKLIIETNYYSETIEVEINESKEINTSYNIDEYSFATLSGKWSDNSTLRFTYMRLVRGGGPTAYDTVVATKIK